MLDEYNAALENYNQKWQALVAQRKNQEFFTELRPVALGWKTKDHAEYLQRVAELRDGADRVIETWMNGRWIAKIHLRDAALSNGIQIIKVMERRPDSTDAAGLDHVDFYTPAELSWSQDVLQAEPNLKWSQESNDIIENYNWLSIWFDGTEAKIKHATVLDIIVAELNQLNQKIVSAA